MVPRHVLQGLSTTGGALVLCRIPDGTLTISGFTVLILYTTAAVLMDPATKEASNTSFIGTGILLDALRACNTYFLSESWANAEAVPCSLRRSHGDTILQLSPTKPMYSVFQQVRSGNALSLCPFERSTNPMWLCGEPILITTPAVQRFPRKGCHCSFCSMFFLTLCS